MIQGSLPLAPEGAGGGEGSYVLADSSPADALADGTLPGDEVRAGRDEVRAGRDEVRAGRDEVRAGRDGEKTVPYEQFATANKRMRELEAQQGEMIKAYNEQQRQLQAAAETFEQLQRKSQEPEEEIDPALQPALRRIDALEKKLQASEQAIQTQLQVRTLYSEVNAEMDRMGVPPEDRERLGRAACAMVGDNTSLDGRTAVRKAVEGWEGFVDRRRATDKRKKDTERLKVVGANGGGSGGFPAMEVKNAKPITNRTELRNFGNQLAEQLRRAE